MQPKVFWICFFVLFTLNVRAQNRKVIEAKSVTQHIKIDGILSEDAWSSASIANDFIQTIPSPDEHSRYKSEIKILYSQSSIYIGAKLYQPRHVGSMQMSTRDELGNSFADYLSIFFDTYDDHQNAFVFRVSITGVQQDERLNGGGSQGDVNWDAVWDSKTTVEQEYWIAEIEIPFSALRFSQASSKKWGLNIGRIVRKENETSYWNRIDVQQSGFLAQSGLLANLDDIKPPVRLFLFPYLSTGYLNEKEASGVRKQILRSGGMDIKYGLSESFTLDLTLVPDFSQVVSDNLVRNLSPFEQQLNENRPFFTEGTELFNKDDLFYSRRIGNRPSGYYKVENQYSDTSKYSIERNPRIATLYNAFKISGRTKNNIGIGLFNALGAPMNAKVFDRIRGEKLPKINTEPLTNYNVIVIDKALAHQSNITLTNTNVIRHGKARDGNVSSLMMNLFDKTETYRASFESKLSLVYQLNKLVAGTVFRGGFEKVSGNLSYNLNFSNISRNYDKTDLGLQFDFNETVYSANVRYNENKLKSNLFQLYRTGVELNYTHNTSPFRRKKLEANAFLFLLFKNFWDINFYTELVPHRPVDYYQLGAFNQTLFTYPYWYNGVNGSSDSRKKLFWAFDVGYGFSNQKHSDYLNIFQSVRYRFNSKFEMSVNGSITRDNSNIGYAYYDETRNLPIVGKRDVYEYNSQISLKYNVNPFMNFTARFRHYNSFLTYTSFHQVDRRGEWQTSLFPFTTTLDENYNLQNIDIFYNWIFKPGSRLVVSFKKWLNNGYIINDQTGNFYFKNVSQIIKTPQSFEAAIRLIYFIDYNQVKANSKLF
jgi:hypothetical protein